MPLKRKKQNEKAANGSDDEMKSRWEMLNRFNKFTREVLPFLLLTLVNTKKKWKSKNIPIRNWHILCTTIPDDVGRSLSPAHSLTHFQSDRKSKCWLSRWGENKEWKWINSKDFFMWFAIERGKKKNENILGKVFPIDFFLHQIDGEIKKFFFRWMMKIFESQKKMFRVGANEVFRKIVFASAKSLVENEIKLLRLKRE